MVSTAFLLLALTSAGTLLQGEHRLSRQFDNVLGERVDLRFAILCLVSVSNGRAGHFEPVVRVNRNLTQPLLKHAAAGSWRDMSLARRRDTYFYPFALSHRLAIIITLRIQRYPRRYAINNNNCDEVIRTKLFFQFILHTFALFPTAHSKARGTLSCSRCRLKQGITVNKQVGKLKPCGLAADPRTQASEAIRFNKTNDPRPELCGSAVSADPRWNPGGEMGPAIRSLACN